MHEPEVIKWTLQAVKNHEQIALTRLSFAREELNKLNQNNPQYQLVYDKVMEFELDLIHWRKVLSGIKKILK